MRGGAHTLAAGGFSVEGFFGNKYNDQWYFIRGDGEVLSLSLCIRAPGRWDVGT
jgi:hypothetical protein